MNQLPTAWPMDEPTATPLYKHQTCQFGIQQSFPNRFKGDLRSGRSHLTEKTRSLALHRHGRSLLGSRRISSGRVRLALVLLRSSRSGRSSDRTGRSAARRGGRTTTTTLTSHIDDVFCEVEREALKVRWIEGWLELCMTV